MCKMKDVNVGIKKLDFTGHRGKMAVYLTDGREIIVPLSFFPDTDGREVIVPLSFFPDIKHLSVKEREGWMILDDQYFTFDRLSKVYSVKDLMTLA